MQQLKTQIWEGFMSLLYKQTILVLTLLFCLGISLSLWEVSRLSENLIEAQALQNAQRTARIMNEARELYSTNVVTKVRTIKGVISCPLASVLYNEDVFTSVGI